MSARLVAVVALLAGLLACSSSPRTPPRDGAPDGGSDGAALDGFVGPKLSALRVSSSVMSDAAASVSMVPAFSPEIFDYYVACTSGTNALTVSMAAPPGTLSALSQPTAFASAAAPKNTIPLTVRENQAIVATATAGNATTEYWVRCLPHDFPPMEWDPYPEAGTRTAGYYLVGNSQPAGLTGYAIALDSNGVPVWYAPHTALGVDDVDSVVPGTISFIPDTETFEIRQFSPLATTYEAPTGGVLDTHELRSLPNGDFLVITDPVKTGVDLYGVHSPLPDGGVESFGPDSTIIDCDVVEFEPSGKVVWTWTGSNHIDPGQETVLPSFQSEADGGVVVDAFHCNSIDVDPTNGNLLVSARNMDAVFYLDRLSGTVLWKLGGTSYNKDGAKYVNVEDPFYAQHDARFQTWAATCGGVGQISVFDDHSTRPGPARGLVLDVTIGAAGSGACGVGVASTAFDAWSYAGAANSYDRGSFRILADGSRIIGWGFGSTRNLVFTEVDSQGHDLLDFFFTNGEFSYRAVKVPLSAFALSALRANAGLR